MVLDSFIAQIENLPKSTKNYDFDEKSLDDVDVEKTILEIFGSQISDKIGEAINHFTRAAYFIKRGKIVESDEQYELGGRMMKFFDGQSLDFLILLSSTSRALRAYKNKRHEEASDILYEAIEKAERYDKAYSSYFFHLYKIQLYFYLAKIYLRESYLDRGVEIIQKLLSYIYLDVNPENTDAWGKEFLERIPAISLYRIKLWIFLDAVKYKLLFSNLYAYPESKFYNSVFAPLLSINTGSCQELSYFKNWLEIKKELFETPNSYTKAINFLATDTYQEFDLLKISIVRGIINNVNQHNPNNLDSIKNAFKTYADDKLWVPFNAKVFLTI